MGGAKKAPEQKRTQADWQTWSERRLRRLLRLVDGVSSLRKRVSLGKDARFDVSLLLAGRPKVQGLNREYRGKDRPTDVLSFPSPGAVARLGSLGDLVICLPIARSVAKELGHSVETELSVLLVHGLLHLLGFDHERGEVEARAMLRWEVRLLRELGVKNPSLIRRTG